MIIFFSLLSVKERLRIFTFYVFFKHHLNHDSGADDCHFYYLPTAFSDFLAQNYHEPRVLLPLSLILSHLAVWT